MLACAGDGWVCGDVLRGGGAAKMGSIAPAQGWDLGVGLC